MRKLILLMGCLMAVIGAWAGKALHQPLVITQSDGTQITVYLNGDEDFYWYTDTSGNILERNGNDFQKVNMDLETYMAKARQTALKNRMRRISVATGTPSYFPHEGSPKALVVLVEFSDTPFSLPDPKKSFDQYLNDTDSLEDYGNYEAYNHGSVRQYFSDMSDGNFTPVFDVVGPVTLSNSLAYYGADSGGSTDVRYMQMVKEALDGVDSEVNFADYDSNSDGYVDLVFFIYAGYAESLGAPSDALWPKAFNTSGYNYSYDGVKTGYCAISSELNGTPTSYTTEPTKRITGVGLFCHEFSHTLGLPDLYVNNAPDNQEMEYWDLMDNGEYTDHQGYTPTPYTPWEKAIMGWKELTELTTEGTHTLNADEAMKVSGDNGEYIILHNVQKEGWASKLYGHGLLVYKICYTGSTVGMSTRPNSTIGSPGVTIAAADGVLISSYKVYATESEKTDFKCYSALEYLRSMYGDPYPGTSGVTKIESVELNNTTIEKPIYNITEENGVITFDFLKDTNLGIDTVKDLDNSSSDPRIYTLDGVYVGTDPEQLPSGIYVRQHQKFIKK